jgi:aspartyl-tRNA(Asn)/glutamyl-tRNA(Gln) amidotransferase subunit C
VALLARLDLTEDEFETFTTQLNSILEHFESLNDLDTSQVRPMTHVIRMENVFRDDEVRPSLDVEEALAGAPDRSGDHFRVPRVID